MGFTRRNRQSQPPQPTLPREGWSGNGSYVPPDPHDPFDNRAHDMVVDGATALGRLATENMRATEQALAARRQGQPSGRLIAPSLPMHPNGGTVLQRHREAVGFTRRDLARISGIDIAEIESVESGGQLRGGAARKLAAALQLEPEALS